MPPKPSLSDTSTLSEPTPIFGFQLWVLLIIFISFLICVSPVVFCFFCLFNHRKRPYKTQSCLLKPIPSQHRRCTFSSSSLDRRLLSGYYNDIEIQNMGQRSQHLSVQNSGIVGDGMRDIGGGKYSGLISDVWRRNGLSMKEIEVATNGMSKDNVIGNGEYGVVYRGILMDNTRVAVKRLLSDSSQIENFIAEMEAIGHVRHRNLVKLIGYCIERPHRMLVYEYIDNGNLHHRLHECPGPVNPLTWSIRMKIIQGVAKGLAYLHDDVEPKVLHGNLKSSNILLDHQWNPKISDYGFAKLFGPQWGHIIMKTLGYLAPDYDSRVAFTEEDDVYSFGTLILEIVSGRKPLNHYKHQPYLVDWLKSMVASEKIAYIVDSKLLEMPPLKELKRVLLVALRCVDPHVNDRPRMGEVIHMLETHDLLICGEQGIRKETSQQNQTQENDTVAISGERSFGRTRGQNKSSPSQKMAPYVVRHTDI